MEEKLNILIIGAHPDDCDFRCGGSAIMYRKAGHHVTFLSVSDGSCGHFCLTNEQLKERRRNEITKVAQISKITYDVWDIPDCEVTANLENRKRMVRYIRKCNPDIIFTHRTNDYHADHRNAALLVQDASYLLTVPLFCSDTPAMSKTPVIMYFYDKFKNPVFEPDIVIPIDEVIDDKYKMFDCHISQVYEWLPYAKGVLSQVPTDPKERLEWLRSPRVPRDTALLAEADLNISTPSNNSEYREALAAVKYRDKIRERYGEKADKVLFAEAFQVSEYGDPLTQENIDVLFPF